MVSRSAFTVTPGSEQIRATITRDKVVRGGNSSCIDTARVLASMVQIVPASWPGVLDRMLSTAPGRH